MQNQPLHERDSVTIDLFGRWQTEKYKPPPAKDVSRIFPYDLHEMCERVNIRQIMFKRSRVALRVLYLPESEIIAQNSNMTPRL